MVYVLVEGVVVGVVVSDEVSCCRFVVEDVVEVVVVKLSSCSRIRSGCNCRGCRCESLLSLCE